MARLFARFPDAIARTTEIAKACSFSLGELKYEYPDEPVLHSAKPPSSIWKISPGRVRRSAIRKTNIPMAFLPTCKSGSTMSSP